MALLVGCSASKKIDKENEIIWPQPPDEPRIKYLKTYDSEDNFLSAFNIATQIIAGKTGVIHLSRPFDVCTDGKKRIYVSDVVQGVIVFNEVERRVEVFGEDVPVPLGNPLGISYGNEKLFVGIGEIGQIVVLTPDGKFIRTIGKVGEFPNPVDVVYNNVQKNLIIVDNKRHQVFIYSEEGDSLKTIGKRGERDGEFNFPQSAAVDKEGNIFIVDAFNFRIQKFDSTGKFLAKYGEQGNLPGYFARPKGIALDSFDNIYVVDAIFNNFQIFNKNFDLLMFVGRFSEEDNWGFNNPIGIYIDQSNKIYVVDQLNQRIQIFQLLKGI